MKNKCIMMSNEQNKEEFKKSVNFMDSSFLNLLILSAYHFSRLCIL